MTDCILYLNPDFTRKILSTWRSLCLHFSVLLPVFLESWYGPQEVTSIPLFDWLSVEGCRSLSEADNILFPIEVEQGEKYLD